MSADNGIYIGRFPKGEGFEYRVIHAQAIENCDNNEDTPKELTQAYRMVYYGKVAPVWTPEEAWAQAKGRFDEIMEGEMPILEYGVSEMRYDEPLPNMTIGEAREYIDRYWADFFLRRKLAEGKG